MYKSNLRQQVLSQDCIYETSRNLQIVGPKMRENEAFQTYTSLLNTFGLNHHGIVAVFGAISSELNRAKCLSLKRKKEKEKFV